MLCNLHASCFNSHCGMVRQEQAEYQTLLLNRAVFIHTQRFLLAQ